MSYEKTFMGMSPIDILEYCGGLYICPRDNDQNRLGPLVTYAAKYSHEGTEKNYVGDLYANFATIERNGKAFRHIADLMVEKLESNYQDVSDLTYCAVPEGGRGLAAVIAVLTGGQHIFLESELTAPSTANKKAEKKLIFGRHVPEPGEKVVIVEDICNQFSSTKETIAAIEALGASVVGILCFLNRSGHVDTEFQLTSEKSIPVIALVRIRMPFHTQEDPVVSKDVEAGNVETKVKKNWDKLMEAMHARAHCVRRLD